MPFPSKTITLIALSIGAALGWTPAAAQPPGRLLASQCAQCHGTDGKGGPFDGIAGEPAAELFKELKELQATPDVDEAIMRVHAQAYTDAQLRLIADYFASVR